MDLKSEDLNQFSPAAAPAAEFNTANYNFYGLIVIFQNMRVREKPFGCKGLGGK